MATPTITREESKNTIMINPKGLFSVRPNKILPRLARDGAVFTVAAALIALSVPRVMSAFNSFASGPILGKIQSQKHVTPKKLRILIKSQNHGLKWMETSRRWTDLAQAKILLANATKDREERRKLYSEAEEALQRGLDISPSSPFAWTRLAYIDLVLNGLSPSVARELRMALTVAPFSPRLLFPRLQLVFVSWSQFDRSDRAVILDQIRLAWGVNPKRLTRIAVDFKRTGLVKAALLKSPKDYSKFKNLLKASR